MLPQGRQKKIKRPAADTPGQGPSHGLGKVLVSLAVILVTAVVLLLLFDRFGPGQQVGGPQGQGQAQFNFVPPSSVSSDPQRAAETSSSPATSSVAASPSESAEAESKTSKTSKSREQELQAQLIQAYINEDFSASELVSQTYCLLDAESGLVLAATQSDQTFAPASLTKVLTALLALEHYADLNEEIQIEEADIAGLAEADASVAGFQAGQVVTIEDLLHGLLLPSGADAAHTLARSIAGSQEAFVQAMNDKAQALGLKDSHFSNPTGLPEDSMYSTAQDMAKLFWTACQDERFVKIAGAAAYSMLPDDYYPEGMQLQSTFIWKFNSHPEFATTLLAGKSGYTGLEQCQASLFEKNGRLYILATLGAKTEDPASTAAVNDQVILMNQLVK